MANDGSDDEDSVVATAEKGELRVEYEVMGILFGENEAKRLYGIVTEEVLPKERWKAPDFTAIAAFFVITHGLIEDRASEILEIEFGGNRQQAGHANNISELAKHGIIESDFVDKMERAHNDRKKTHHGFREMVDQLLEDDFEERVENMRAVRLKMRDEIIKRKNGPVLDD